MTVHPAGQHFSSQLITMKSLTIVPETINAHAFIGIRLCFLFLQTYYLCSCTSEAANFSFITVDISHEQNTGERPNLSYSHMKCEKFQNLHVRKGFGRVLVTCTHVHANVTCTTFDVNEMRWLKVAAPAFQSITLLPVRPGTISTTEPSKVTLM